MNGPRLKKALGQHFLTRPEVCAPLVDFLAPSGRRVFEIGPGDGALTGALLEAGARLVAWEVDLAWAVRLRQRFPGARLSVVAGDATQIDWIRLFPGALVAGNLPYNVSTALVLDCLESVLDADDPYERAAFLVQKEVGERLAALPGRPGYGSLSVLTRALAEVDLLGRVPPGAFRPPPKVDSSFVGFRPSSEVGASEYAELKPFVRAAFAHRRKTLRNSLASSLGAETATALVDRARLPPDVRAEQLDLAAFRSLLALLGDLRPPNPLSR